VGKSAGSGVFAVAGASIGHRCKQNNGRGAENGGAAQTPILSALLIRILKVTQNRSK
jgi:hypothetical protein